MARWFRRPAVEDAALPQDDEPVALDPWDMEEIEEPLGTFDHPHRIRSREQMEADDLTNPITADAFLAYSQKRGDEARARAEFDLSIWDHVPEPEEDYVNHAEATPEPVVVAGKVTRTERAVERLLDRLRR